MEQFLAFIPALLGILKSLYQPKPRGSKKRAASEDHAEFQREAQLKGTQIFCIQSPFLVLTGAVAGLVGIEGGVVSGVFNLESPGVEAPDWRPRHDEH